MRYPYIIILLIPLLLSWQAIHGSKAGRTASGLNQLEHVIIQENFKTHIQNLLKAQAQVDFLSIWSKDLGQGQLVLTFSYLEQLGASNSQLTGQALLIRQDFNTWKLEDVYLSDQQITFTQDVLIEVSKLSEKPESSDTTDATSIDELGN